MNQSPRPHRSGFTLLQLLVVIGIFGILLALIVPAVQQVREAARRTTCMNNIRQLTMGIWNYESAHKRYPQAVGIRTQADTSLPEATDRYSGFLSFFQYLGRYPGPYYDEAVEVQGVTYPAYPEVDEAGHPLWSLQHPALLCPSIPVADSEFGSIHYAFSIGDVARNVHSPNAIRGAFAVGRSQTHEKITDGLSYTIALAEIGGFRHRSLGSRFAVNQPSKFLDNPSLTSELVDRSGGYKRSVKLARMFRGGNWGDGTGGPSLVNTILPPGSPSLLVCGDTAVDGFYSASENHRGGTVVGFLDSSAKFISKDIDVSDQQHPVQSAEELLGTKSSYGIWGALGSANGAESIDGSILELRD